MSLDFAMRELENRRTIRAQLAKVMHGMSPSTVILGRRTRDELMQLKKGLLGSIYSVIVGQSFVKHSQLQQ